MSLSCFQLFQKKKIDRGVGGWGKSFSRIFGFF